MTITVSDIQTLIDRVTRDIESTIPMRDRDLVPQTVADVRAECEGRSIDDPGSENSLSPRKPS